MKRRKVSKKKKLWKIFSQYIRRRDDGVCFTCGIKKPYKQMQAGHFITAANCGIFLYFHEKNVHCQCYRCNINLSGNWVEYEKALDKTYGEGTAKELKSAKYLNHKWTDADYDEKIKEYKGKLERL